MLYGLIIQCGAFIFPVHTLRLQHKMYIAANSLDDLLRAVFRKILRSGSYVVASKGGNTELCGVVLELKNPLARLSRTETKGTAFSCLGETLWYMAKTDELDFIQYYLPHYDEFAESDGTVHGAYGPRLFDMRGENQIENVTKLLRKRPTSRQAVIQLFNAEDISVPYNDVPCTCTLQFFVRDSRLDAVVHMRSNDAFIGLPHDIFAFTFIQEIIATRLCLGLGTYKHMVGSLHIYDEKLDLVRKFIKEGYQSRISMPPMPTANPWPNLKKLIAVESRIRSGRSVNVDSYSVLPYWADLMRLLQVFSANKAGISTVDLRTRMASRIYDSYIKKSSRVDSKGKK